MQPELHTCKNCGNTFEGKFCNRCGEKIYSEKDKTIRHIFSETFHFITHFDGKFLTTVRTMIRNPGKLSDDYCNGVRRRYFNPFSLFLLLVVLYLIFPIFDGLNMHLQYYQNNNFFGDYAAPRIDRVLAKHHLAFPELDTEFRHKAEKVSKFLLFMLIPCIALITWLFTFRKRPPFFDQMVFSAEICSLFVMWGFLLFPLIYVLFFLLCRLIHVRPPIIQDEVAGLFVYIPYIIWMARGLSRFYRLPRVLSILLALLLAVAMYFIIAIPYKFILFAIVISQF